MTISPKTNPVPVFDNSKTVKRAERALNCAPFLPKLFITMQNQSVPLQEISSREGHQQGYTRQPLSENAAESELVWLIQVGLLRREVDGQGITDSFRLTPLGRKLMAQYETETQKFPSPSWGDYLINSLTRWMIGFFR